MKPIMMHGHERSITQIKYNREGDLLFSCAKVSLFARYQMFHYYLHHFRITILMFGIL